MTKYLLWVKGVGNKPTPSLVYEQPTIDKNGRLASANGQGDEVIQHIKVPKDEESYSFDALIIKYPAYGE